LTAGPTDFDHLVDRTGTASLKWGAYAADVLPLWVADMDFPAPPPVVAAVQEFAAHGVYGYTRVPGSLEQAVRDFLADSYDWPIEPEWLVFLPGVVPALNLVCRAWAAPGEAIMTVTPVYPPFLEAPRFQDRLLQPVPAVMEEGRWRLPLAEMEAAVTPTTRVFLFCHPHNPFGRAWEPDEVAAVVDFCHRHEIVLCSDEIHCDLLLDPVRHLPAARVSAEAARRTITLMAPSKTFNVPGLKCSVAIVPNPDLCKTLKATHAGLVHGINIMGYVAALAGYRDGRPWLDELLRYLEANRDFLAGYVEANLPGITMRKPEGTYLAWLDCRDAGIPGNPHEFFVKEARVAVNDGKVFGLGGEGFVRLNFGCPRSMLTEALDKMQAALLALRRQS